MCNAGVEVMLNLNPVRVENSFRWDVSLNWARNRSKIVSTGSGVDNFFIGNDRNVTVAATPDRPFGDFRGRGFKRNPDGQIIVDAQGLPLIATQDVVIGNYLPDWFGGINNVLTYKGFRLNFLFDMRKGGDILSLSIYMLRKTAMQRQPWLAGPIGMPVRVVSWWTA